MFIVFIQLCQVSHICVSKLTITGSDHCLLSGQYQVIIWTNAEILLVWTLGTNSEIYVHFYSRKYFL